MGTEAIIIYVVGGVTLLIVVGIVIFCCCRNKSPKSENTSRASILDEKQRVTKQSDSRVVLQTGRNAISDDVWNPKLDDLDNSINGRMTIKRPDVELRPAVNNEAFELNEADTRSELSSLPERDYEIKDGLTDIDIMMQDEFNELERDYPHAR